MVVLSLILTGCQAGQNAPTSQPYNPVDGRNVNVPDDATLSEPYIGVRDALVILGDDGVAALGVTVVNNSDEADVLESVVIGGTEATLSGGPIEFAAHTSVSLGFGENASAAVAGFEGEVGQWTDLMLRFTKSGTAELSVLALAPSDGYQVPKLDAGDAPLINDG